MTIFILGASTMQLPAIRIARELGWRVVVADANPEAPGAGLADLFLPIDLKDKVALEEAARGLRADGGMDGVFTAGTDFSASVAWVAERLGLPGISHETALKASDKLRMRAVFEAAGLSSPRFVEVQAGEGGGALGSLAAAGLGFPLVVKPADSMGSRGCRSVAGEAELQVALADAFAHSRSHRAIVEEYIEGPEFSVDAIVLDGEIRIRGLADRHIFFSPYFVELGHTMPSSQSRGIQAEVLSVFESGVRAIGIGRGAAKGDIKYCPSRGKAVIGEIAARLSGGYMSGWTYPYASGIEVTREALETAVGLSPPRPGQGRGWVSAERAFISIPGRVAAVIGAVEAQRLPFIKDVFLRVAPGDMTVFPSNNVEKCGNVISQAGERSEAVRAAESAVGCILIRLAPAKEATEAFLRGEGSLCGLGGAAWPPSAYRLPRSLEHIIDAMPESLKGDEAGGPLVVLPLEGAEALGELDWAGRSLARSASLALELGGARYGHNGGRILGSRFWRALARGGAQAGLYVLDTERALGP